jgi:hypothetical protein
MSINPEKIPDAPRHSVSYAGVTVESRYGKRHELEDMMAALDWAAMCEPGVLCMIKGVFCDSKAQRCYGIVCCHRGDIEDIASLFDAAFRAAGGHNGVYAGTGVLFGEPLAHRDRRWPEMSAHPDIVATSTPPDARALLEVAVAELDLIVAEGLARDAGDRLNGAAGLIEEALAKLEERER